MWQLGSLAARKCRENEKMRWKWRENEEMERKLGNGERMSKWRKIHSLHFLIFILKFGAEKISPFE